MKLDGLLNDHTLTEYKKAKIVPTRLQYEDHYKSSSSIKSIKKKASECLLKRPYGQTRNVERKLIEKCQCSEHKDSGGDKVGRPYATIQSAGQSKDASANNSKLSEFSTPDYISMEEHKIKMKNQIAAFLNDLHALNNTFDKTMLDLMIVFWGEKLK